MFLNLDYYEIVTHRRMMNQFWSPRNLISLIDIQLTPFCNRRTLQLQNSAAQYEESTYQKEQKNLLNLEFI